MKNTCEHCGKEVTGQYCHACGMSASKKTFSKRKAVGICLIVAPWVGLIVILSLYAIVSFMVSAMAGATAGLEGYLIDAAHAVSIDAQSVAPAGAETMRDTAGSAVSLMLGFLGVLCILGIFIGTPIGMYLLFTEGKPKAK